MNSRSHAARILRQVISEGRSLTAALDAALPAVAQDNDRAFVQNLCFGVTRWYEQLDFLLRQLAAKPIRDEEIRLLALIGLYQLEHTRVKPHAAVSATVDAADHKQWAKPLLNGILRNYQRRRDELLARVAQDPAAAVAHPLWLVGKLRKQWPDAAEAIFAQANQQPPFTLRVNRRQISRDAYLDRLRQAGLAAEACIHAADGIVLQQPLPVEQLPGFAQGQVSVQDEAAQLAADLLDLQPGQRVLDLCAAPGGKTLHILERQPDLAELLALDNAAERLDKIDENLARAGLSARVVSGDAGRPAKWWDGIPFDRILLDAPCSATGVIRRHPDIKLLRRADDIAALQASQRRILHAIWPLLAAGGRLVYATCSILKDENESQIIDFLQQHPNASASPIQADWGQPRPAGRQILSGEQGMDGFYYACLVKQP